MRTGGEGDARIEVLHAARLQHGCHQDVEAGADMERLHSCRGGRVQARLGRPVGLALQQHCARERANDGAPVGAHPQVLHQRAHQVPRLAVPAADKSDE